MKQFGKTLPKTVDALIELAREQDWHVSKTTSGHPRLVSPRGQIVIGSGTSGDSNWIWDFRSRLKRAGLKPPKGKKHREEKDVAIHTTQVPAAAPDETPAEGKKPRKPRTTNPGVRAGMRDAIMDALRSHDRPDGVSTADIAGYVEFKLGRLAKNNLSSSLTWYSTEKGGSMIHKVSRARWRLTEKYRVMEPGVVKVEVPPLPAVAPTPPALQPPPVVAALDEEDKALQNAMDSIMAALDVIDRTIRRNKETRKKLLEVLGTIK